MYQKLKKQCRNRRNYGRRYSNWLQKPKHLLGASAAPYDFSRIFWPYLKNSDRGTSFEPNMTSFEQKMTELRGFENWSQMAIYDPPPNFGTLPRGPQGPQDPKSPAKLVTIGSRFGQVKKIDIEFFSCWTAGLVLNDPLSYKQVLYKQVSWKLAKN